MAPCAPYRPSQIQLAMREGESFVTPSAFSEIFVKLDKTRKAEKSKPIAPAGECHLVRDAHVHEWQCYSMRCILTTFYYVLMCDG